MYLYNERLEKVKNYFEKISSAQSKLKTNSKNILKELKSYMCNENKDYIEGYSNLKSSLWTENIKHITEVFSDENMEALELILGKEHGEKFKKIWDRATNYTYSKGYLRKSYRTNKSSKLYLEKNIDKLIEITYLMSIDFSLDDYLSNMREEYKNTLVISDIIALEIDENNDKVLDKIRDIIYSENNTAVVTREIIRGLLMSKNQEAHKLIGELLLAAKLQEGLRQVIVESMDECSKEGLIYILKIIVDNNLMRFSSVTRGFTTWTGLGVDIERPKFVSKCFETAHKCLIDERFRDECLKSDDTICIYVALWSIAFYEVKDLDEYVENLLKAKETYKRLVGLKFINDTQFYEYRHKVSCLMLNDDKLEVNALALSNLFGNYGIWSIRNGVDFIKEYSALGKAYYGIELFNSLHNIINKMPKKEVVFEEQIFPWFNISISVSDILEKMMLSIAGDYNDDMIDLLFDYKNSMNVNVREVFVQVFLKNPNNEKQKAALFQLCGDRGESVRTEAFKIVDNIELKKEEYLQIEELLKYKSGDLRKSAIKLLLKQENKELKASIERLVNSKDDNKALAAIDLVEALDSSKEKLKLECIKIVESISHISERGKRLSIKDVDTDVKTMDNGLGLYDKKKPSLIGSLNNDENIDKYELFTMTAEEINEILNAFSELIHENRDLEYEVETWDGRKIVVTLGGERYLYGFARDSDGIDNYPLSEEIKKLKEKLNLDLVKLIELGFYLGVISGSRYSRENLKWWYEILKATVNKKILIDNIKDFNKIPYYEKIEVYIRALINELPKVEKFKIGRLMSKYMYFNIPLDKHKEHCKDISDVFGGNYRYFIISSYEINYWINLMKNSICDDESFRDYFIISYNYYRNNGYLVQGTLTIEDFAKALEYGLIDKNEIYKELLEREMSKDNLLRATRLTKKELQEFGSFEEILNSAVNTIVSIEGIRGELNTEVTHLAAGIKKCFGVENFVTLLLNCEKDTFIRGYNFVNGDATKKQMISYLLKCCYPNEGDNSEDLKKLLKGKKIKDKNIIEAAMYSPQWLDIVSEYLGYDGLKLACWYFHAHVNHNFTEEKESIIARYSSIAAQDFKDGAFDQNWFKEAYEAMGEKNFKLVYDSAKYIAGGSLHKRSQLFADATLGKMNIDKVKERVVEKRNKDYLLTYALIPIEGKKDLLERYEYIHEFIKESKKFGAQRKASEGRCGEVALLNLSRNAGYTDVNRLSWSMETEKSKAIKPYLMKKKIDEVEVQLFIDEMGRAEILCYKNEKTLKDIPSKLKKNQYVEELKELKKSLKDQYIRGKKSLEEAMEKGSYFTLEEIDNLSTNLVIGPMIKKLVFISGDKEGYLRECTLVDYNGEIHELNNEDKIIIAHPFNLYEKEVWSHYQKHIFVEKIVQPFKQVFRELYLPTKDEIKERNISRRYAGYQIQPKKAAALLKSRGWLVNPEEGLQKVYYDEDIIVTIYALADWFSPSDIEAPTLEVTRFEHRRTNKPVLIENVPKNVFSEVMRDLDLVVSVAYVGGVDPEASLSTIEIRRVVLEELVTLLKLGNVELKENHAYIKGTYGEYTVHLGSGTTHKMSKGYISIIPVHSSHRGEIFLPFIDEDPKSAEIISKIVMLSNDKNIKDPTILEQIV